MTQGSSLRDRFREATDVSRATIHRLEARVEAWLSRISEKGRQAHEVGRDRLNRWSTNFRRRIGWKRPKDD